MYSLPFPTCTPLTSGKLKHVPPYRRASSGMYPLPSGMFGHVPTHGHVRACTPLGHVRACTPYPLASSGLYPPYPRTSSGMYPLPLGMFRHVLSTIGLKLLSYKPAKFYYFTVLSIIKTLILLFRFDIVIMYNMKLHELHFI